MVKKAETPAGLSKSAAEWYATVLRQHGFKTAAQKEILAQAARALTRMEDCRVEIKKHGLVVKGHRGMVPNPACRLEAQARQQYLSACRLLHLARAASGKLAAEEPRNMRQYE